MKKTYLFTNPKWLVYFFDLVNRIPIPKWLLAGLVVVISGVAHHLAAWRKGVLIQGEIDLFLVFAGVGFVLYPYYWQLLSKRANEHLSPFLLYSGKNNKETIMIIEDFNSISEKSSLILVSIGLVASVFSFYLVGLNEVPLLRHFPWSGIVAYFLIGSVGFLAFSRLVRQVFLMRRMYSELEVDIFRPFKVYDLSEYGAFASASLILIFYFVTFLSIPRFIYLPFGIIWQIIIFVVGILLFVFPLFGINSRMRRAKDELLIQNGEHLKAIFEEIDIAAQGKNYPAIDKLRGSLSTLAEAKELVQKVSTWPWQASTLTNFILPLLVPVLAFVIQLFIENQLIQ